MVWYTGGVLGLEELVKAVCTGSSPIFYVFFFIICISSHLLYFLNFYVLGDVARMEYGGCF